MHIQHVLGLYDFLRVESIYVIAHGEEIRQEYRRGLRVYEAGCSRAPGGRKEGVKIIKARTGGCGPLFNLFRTCQKSHSANLVVFGDKKGLGCFDQLDVEQ